VQRCRLAAIDSNLPGCRLVCRHWFADPDGWNGGLVREHDNLKLLLNFAAEACLRPGDSPSRTLPLDGARLGPWEGGRELEQKRVK
jgi:hypothetical protein